MVETVYHSDEAFREAFVVFNSMREASEHTDIILRGDGDTDHDPGGIACHRLVLAAVILAACVTNSVSAYGALELRSQILQQNFLAVDISEVLNKYIEYMKHVQNL